MMQRIIVLFIAVLCPQASVLAAQAFGVTKQELAMLPPYCTAKYGKNHGEPQTHEHPLRSTIPPHCPSLHHYCDGLKAMLRVDRNRTERDFWLGKAVQSFQGVADDWDQNGQRCALRSEVHYKLGDALSRRSTRGGGPAGLAVQHFGKALELNPNYLPAYFALSDYYADIGDKQKALSIAEDGLRRLPSSKGLLRRFRRLGGKIPPEPVAVTPKSNATLEPSKDAAGP